MIFRKKMTYYIQVWNWSEVMGSSWGSLKDQRGRGEVPLMKDCKGGVSWGTKRIWKRANKKHNLFSGNLKVMCTQLKILREIEVSTKFQSTLWHLFFYQKPFLYLCIFQSKTSTTGIGSVLDVFSSKKKHLICPNKSFPSLWEGDFGHRFKLSGPR